MKSLLFFSKVARLRAQTGVGQIICRGHAVKSEKLFYYYYFSFATLQRGISSCKARNCASVCVWKKELQGEPRIFTPKITEKQTLLIIIEPTTTITKYCHRLDGKVVNNSLLSLGFNKYRIMYVQRSVYLRHLNKQILVLVY